MVPVLCALEEPVPHQQMTLVVSLAYVRQQPHIPPAGKTHGSTRARKKKKSKNEECSAPEETKKKGEEGEGGRDGKNHVTYGSDRSGVMDPPRSPVWLT